MLLDLATQKTRNRKNSFQAPELQQPDGGQHPWPRQARARGELRPEEVVVVDDIVRTSHSRASSVATFLMTFPVMVFTMSASFLGTIVCGFCEIDPGGTSANNIPTNVLTTSPAMVFTMFANFLGTKNGVL